MGLSVLTLVRNREAHLRQLVEGLRRSQRQPDELIVIVMGGETPRLSSTPFPVEIDHMATPGLPLAAARNRAASLARHETLVFLDVDCIPMAQCLDKLKQALDEADGLACADIRYLGPHDARKDWFEADLIARGRAHPARPFPDQGVHHEANPGLFWSLAFAIHRARFDAIGGFDERFTGYGGEDTDFGFRAAAAGYPLMFVGGAIACHQHHDSHEPPVQHVHNVVRNARLFHSLWGRWPMEGWLAAFDAMGLVEWKGDMLAFRRTPTAKEQASTLSAWPQSDLTDQASRAPVLR